MPTNPERPAEIAQVIGNAELAKRVNDMQGQVAALHESVRTLEKSQAEGLAKIITWIFSGMAGFVAVCAILVTVLGLFSKSETHDAVKDMDAKFDKANADMQKRFEAFSGEALKK